MEKTTIEPGQIESIQQNIGIVVRICNGKSEYLIFMSKNKWNESPK